MEKQLIKYLCDNICSTMSSDYALTNTVVNEKYIHLVVSENVRYSSIFTFKNEANNVLNDQSKVHDCDIASGFESGEEIEEYLKDESNFSYLYEEE